MRPTSNIIFMVVNHVSYFRVSYNIAAYFSEADFSVVISLFLRNSCLSCSKSTICQEQITKSI